MVNMKHGSNQRRSRSRGNSGKRHQSSRGNSHESNGPDGKVRGSAQQVYEKYISMARDATAAGEPITAEGYYQFAEHYFRIINLDSNHNRNRDQQSDPNQSDQAIGAENGTSGFDSSDKTPNEGAYEEGRRSAGKPGAQGKNSRENANKKNNTKNATEAESSVNPKLVEPKVTDVNASEQETGDAGEQVSKETGLAVPV